MNVNDYIHYKNIHSALQKKNNEISRTELIQGPKRMLFDFPKIQKYQSSRYKSKIPRINVSTPLYTVKSRKPTTSIIPQIHKHFNLEMPRVETPYKKQLMQQGFETERQKYDPIEEFIRRDIKRSLIIYNLP